ncbi:hypothetical protein [Novosphingobium sp. FSW06-99]|uniref:hypothetical protein n=1 Tax=Novosphingobium sp. FSW06-99 TaxID=1739113 RepID=UPI00076C1E13|nr:hypothetical protein [Novosphingobium sp. FSW06-99]KUR80681.1 hypothetical protein AQZ49_01185 [Novosphingobium sp. FSW06-99]
MCCAVAAAFVLSLTFRPVSNVSAFMLHRQDRWLLLVAVVLALICRVRLPRRCRLPQVGYGTLLLVALGLLSITYLGHFLVLCGYDLSRDEQMASFDAEVFGQGHLVGPLPAFWRDHADALNTLFMVPAGHRAAWISDYLPINAGLRAIVGLIGMPYLVGPSMTAIGAIALWGCVRRLWPADREAVLVALLLYVGSAQVLFAGMTSYAMPDHLALNLVWLWLFLHRTRVADLAALVVGFAANALHQPLFHPIFVVPFMLVLVHERRWDRLGLYACGYAAIVGFWAWWPGWVWSLVQAGPDAPRPHDANYIAHVAAMVRDRDPMGMADMVANLLRFVAWQHLLLVPLMLIGARLYRKDPMTAALAGGLVLATLVMALILPYQGHGFGYRYLHGMIGNAILLAIHGWKSLDDRTGQSRALLLRTSAVGMLVLIPMQAWMSHVFYAPSAEVSARLDKIDADYLVIGGDDVPTARDVVLNRPALDRRPLRLLREKLDPATIAAICASHPRVALIGNTVLDPIGKYYALGHWPVDAINRDFAPGLASAGCAVRIVG